MKPNQIHPASLVLGLVIAVACTLTMSQRPVDILSHKQVQVEYGPHPRSMMQVRANTPFVVPPGRIFVLTALGTPGLSFRNAVLKVDGVQQLAYSRQDGNPSTLSVAPAPIGFTVQAGSIILLDDLSQDVNAFAWGYLADQ